MDPAGLGVLSRGRDPVPVVVVVPVRFVIRGRDPVQITVVLPVQFLSPGCDPVQIAVVVPVSIITSSSSSSLSSSSSVAEARIARCALPNVFRTMSSMAFSSSSSSSSISESRIALRVLENANRRVVLVVRITASISAYPGTVSSFPTAPGPPQSGSANTFSRSKPLGNGLRFRVERISAREEGDLMRRTSPGGSIAK